MRCAVCGEENSSRARFCSNCGAALVAATRGVAQERKVVSVLFCDLVGFTAASEFADPEDVQNRLSRYHRMLQRRIENFGGTVEKFIGDAVMAVFGAPTAHEDDPERAVRAGLAILSSIEELNAESGLDLAVRVGINTGEAVVSLEARPEAGEGYVTGDVVNTAARIQSAAPVGAVAVGATTYDATRRIFEYEQLEPVTVKGKSAPLTLWRAGPPRARLGVDVLRSMDAPLVGRELELLQLRTAFDRTARDAVVQLVTVTGEPGVGKSRLVAELADYVQELPTLVRWRQGRCLPYGDGVTFWALGEIVKAHAGVLESDSPEAATEKLDQVLPRCDDPDWLRARLLPLLGIDSGLTVSREESFSAWRRFVESLAETRPAVVVIEDLHWADEALLEFLEYLADWAHGIPLLIVCTARPELFEAHPQWGSGLRNTMTIALAPLTETETAALVAQLLGRPVLPAETQRLIVAHAEGNPLWAEECVRVLRDRGLVDDSGRVRSDTTTVPLPQGIQALITARLDTLPLPHKALLGDAAVIGRVFWAAALSAVGDRTADEVATAVHELTAKELIRPSRQSRLAGQVELSFWHGLVRDVAYSTIPRRARATKHVAAARWLEEEGAVRVEDVAEILAYHTGEALSLADAIGDTALTAEIGPLARRHALVAARKVSGLDPARAIQLYERALALTPADDPDHPAILLRWAQMAYQLGRMRDSADAASAAARAFEERGDAVAAGGALAKLGRIQRRLADPAAGETTRAALALLDPQPSSRELVEPLADVAALLMLAGAFTDAITVADRALSIADQLGMSIPAPALAARASARSALGDGAGLADYEQAIPLLIAAGETYDAAATYNNLAVDRWCFDGPEAALATLEQGRALAESRGLFGAAQSIRVSELQALLEIGRFDEVLRAADELAAKLEKDGEYFGLTELRAVQARVLLERGEGGHAIAEQALADARRIDAAAMMPNAGLAAALSRARQGDHKGVRAVCSELVELVGPGQSTEYAPRLPALVRCAVAADALDLARQLAELELTNLPVKEHSTVTARALMAQATGDDTSAIADFTDAAGRWAGFGNRVEQAYAHLGLGRSLAALGEEALGPVLRARELFTEMGARPGVQECDVLLAGDRERTG